MGAASVRGSQARLHSQSLDQSLECKREHKSAGFVAARSGAPNAKGASASSNRDMACVAARSLTGVDRWVAFGVIADNLINMGHVM
jgi:hypothetical protein